MFPEIIFDSPELILAIDRDNNVIRITEPHNATSIEITPDDVSNGGGFHIRGIRKMFPTIINGNPAIKVL